MHPKRIWRVPKKTGLIWKLMHCTVFQQHPPAFTADINFLLRLTQTLPSFEKSINYGLLEYFRSQMTMKLCRCRCIKAPVDQSTVEQGSNWHNPNIRLDFVTRHIRVFWKQKWAICATHVSNKTAFAVVSRPHQHDFSQRCAGLEMISDFAGVRKFTIILNWRQVP